MLTSDFSPYFNQNHGNHNACGFGQFPACCPCTGGGAWAAGSAWATGANPVDPYPNQNPDCLNGCLGANGPDCPKCPWADCCRVYGGLINANATNILIPTCSRGNAIPLDGSLPMLNVSFVGVNNLRVQCSGTYQLTIFGNFSVGTLGTGILKFYVKANGHVVEESAVDLWVNATSGPKYSFERTVFVRLCADTTLAMAVDAGVETCVPGSTNFLLEIPARGFHMEIKRVGSFTGN